MRSDDGDRRDAGGDITACASSSVDSPPASTKRCQTEEAEAPRKKAKQDHPAEPASTANESPIKSPSQPSSPRATESGGPAVAELRGTKPHTGAHILPHMVPVPVNWIAHRSSACELHVTLNCVPTVSDSTLGMSDLLACGRI